MVKVAFIDESNGEISSIRAAGSSDQYKDGVVYNGRMAKHIPADADDYFISSNYWDGVEFAPKPAKPSPSHVWRGAQWRIDESKVMELLRQGRDYKLLTSDWTQLMDSPLTTEKQSEWANYRQILRDMPSVNLANTSLDDIMWPIQPEASPNV